MRVAPLAIDRSQKGATTGMDHIWLLASLAIANLILTGSSWVISTMLSPFARWVSAGFNPSTRCSGAPLAPAFHPVGCVEDSFGTVQYRGRSDKVGLSQVKIAPSFKVGRKLGSESTA